MICDFHLYIMASKNDSNWYQNYEALKAYIQERGHLPDKHVVENRALLSWAKYQRKKIKEGTLDEDKRELFESLLATRSTEHTGGRRKKDVSNTIEY
ncbi:MAG: helicase associated domain-containing protein [Prevotellaceae bacterium]|nr:helicase associated domain-containing protein [Candidatus Colivivens equi]